MPGDEGMKLWFSIGSVDTLERNLESAQVLQFYTHFLRLLLSLKVNRLRSKLSPISDGDANRSQSIRSCRLQKSIRIQ